MNRKLLFPIVALVALMVKEFTGIELAEQQIDVIIEGILAIAVLSGVFMTPNKK
jgi:uncharacterized membrane protein